METKKRYVYHLDDLRKQKKITIKELCEGICDERSYRRYLSGERELKQEFLSKFCVRLGISINDFYYSFMERDKFEYETVANMYDLLLQKDYNKLNIVVKNNLKKKYTNAFNSKFLNYIHVRFLVENDKINPYDAYDRYSSIVNYPTCKKSNIFDFADILTLLRIADLESGFKKKRTTAINLLYRILKNREVRFLTFDNKYMMANLYGDLAILFGRLGKIESSFDIATEGIKYSLSIGNNDALTQLYYASSLCSYKMGNKNQAYIDAARCIATIISRKDDHRYKLYVQLFKDDFGVDEKTLLNFYMNSK